MPANPFENTTKDLGVSFARGALQEFTKQIHARQGERREVRKERRLLSDRKSLLEEGENLRRETAEINREANFEIQKALDLFKANVISDIQRDNKIEDIKAQAQAKRDVFVDQANDPDFQTALAQERLNELKPELIKIGARTKAAEDKKSPTLTTSLWSDMISKTQEDLFNLTITDPDKSKAKGLLKKRTPEQTGALRDDISRASALMSSPKVGEKKNAKVNVGPEEAIEQLFMAQAVQDLLDPTNATSPIVHINARNHLNENEGIEFISVELALQLNREVTDVTGRATPIRNFVPAPSLGENLTIDDIVDALIRSDATDEQMRSYLSILSRELSKDLIKRGAAEAEVERVNRQEDIQQNFTTPTIGGRIGQ